MNLWNSIIFEFFQITKLNKNFQSIGIYLKEEHKFNQHEIPLKESFL